MGTLSEELAATMLRNFHLAQVTAESQWQDDLAARMDKPPTWSWASGTFVFPEGLCCYCGGVMRSPAIWRTDNLQFLGSWKVCDGPNGGHFSYVAEHPHVNNGSICMGGGDYRASSVADALFLAFNPLSTYFYGLSDAEGNLVSSTEEVIKEWFADRFDHRCGEQANTATIAGVDIRHAVAPEAGCHCQHCRMHRGEVRCQRDGCGQWYDARTGHGRWRCDVCDRRNRMHFCIKHKHDRKRCTDCGDIYDLYNVDLGGLDPEPNIKQCDECSEWVCTYCLGEAEESVPQHECVEGAVEGHTCCDCGICCDCGESREF